MKPARYIWALNITRRCNLKCSYCYYNDLTDEGEMDDDTAARAVQFALQNTPENSRADIGFFGREPLLRFDLIKQLMLSAAKNPGISFSLNTNGTLLNPEILTFLEENRVKISISVDGTRTEHDESRRVKNGGSSYNLLEKSLKGVVGYKPPVYARMTVTAGNADSFYENAVHIFNLGFKKIGFAYDLTDQNWKKETYEALRRSMDLFSVWYADAVIQGREISVPSFDSLARGRRVPEEGLFCGAAKSLFCVDYDGTIYPCWRFAGDPSWKMGDIFNGFSCTPENHPFNKIRQQELGKCSGCAHKRYCGRCAWGSLKLDGDACGISEVQCVTSKISIEAGLSACEKMISAGAPIFLKRLEKMTAVSDGSDGFILTDGDTVFKIPEEELEKYRKK